MNIGICGGTFDPFHCGHLDPILAARGAMQWDRVLYVPAYVQPFKTDRETAPAHHRFAMTALATLSHDGFTASPIELERGAISYSVDTLTALRAQYPGAAFDWIIGDDNLEKLTEWKSIDRIFELANFAVLTRLGRENAVILSREDGEGSPADSTSRAPNQGILRRASPAQDDNSIRSDERTPNAPQVPATFASRVTETAGRPRHGAIVFTGNPTVPVSSTEVRRRIRAGEPIEELVPPPVSRYIQHYELYRKAQS